MGRGRIPMEVIQKEKARKTTFQKRKNGLMKKVFEFSTLCGVDACLIIYAPDFDDQGVSEFETWPQDAKEVNRIIQKYNNTTSDRRPRIYDVQEYFKDRMKKVEAEISKVHKEKLKIMYPTWDNSFNALGEEQLRMFVNSLDAKLNACNQRINILKGDKGKGIIEPINAVSVASYLDLASNPSSHFDFLQNMSQGQQFFPSPMKAISDNNPLSFYPYQLGQSSQSNMLHFGQNCLQLMGNNLMADNGAQYDSETYDLKTSLLKEDGVENKENVLPYYYNGNIHATTQPYSIAAMQTLPSQNSQYEAVFQALPNLPPPPGFQPHAFYDPNMLQAHLFNYMHERK